LASLSAKPAAELALSVSVKPMWITSYVVSRAASFERPSPIATDTPGSEYGRPDQRASVSSTMSRIAPLSSMTSTFRCPELSAFSMSRPPPPPITSVRPPPASA
jgi:hypothetical protein